MTRPLAFPALSPDVHERAAALGVDLEASFRGFMSSLFDCDPDSERIDRVIAEAAPAPIQRVARTPVACVLTPHQLRTLRLLANGYSPAETAAALVCSHHTTKMHVRHIRERLNVGNVAGAVAVALRTGLIRPDEIAEPGQQSAAA